MGKKVGRPSLYSEELCSQICFEIAGGRSLVSVLNEKGMPDYSTVMRWVDKHAEFREKYARAMDARADLMADELLKIADDRDRDFTETENGQAFNSEHVQRARLRVDTRKWIMARMSPKKYGDRVQTELTGVNGGPILSAALPTADMTPEEAAKRYLAVMRNVHD